MVATSFTRWRAFLRSKYFIVVVVGILASSGYATALTLLGTGNITVRVLPPVELDKDTFLVYNDQGILPITEPEMWDLWTWDGSDWGAAGGNLQPGEFDADYPMDSAPEGERVFRTKSGPNSPECNNVNYAGWGIVLAGSSFWSDHIVDLSDYDQLKFWVKTPADLKVEVRENYRWGTVFTKYLSEVGWTGEDTWQEITIPVTSFTKKVYGETITLDPSRIFSPFMITVEYGDNTFYVDNVRWIKKSGVGNARPTADFSYSPWWSPTPDDVINFTGQWIDPDGEVVSWLWDFGDGSTSSARNPTHQYPTGVYTVTLTVTDDGGASSSTSETIVVTYPPTAAFEYSPASPSVDNLIQFTDLSTDQDGNIVKWIWNFGDGDNSTEQNPTHRYSVFGEYLVSLTVTDDLGATGCVSQTIPVRGKPGTYGIYGDGGSGVDVSWINQYDDDNDYPWAVRVYEDWTGGSPPDPERSLRYIFDGSTGHSGGAYLEFHSSKDMSAYENLVFWVKGKNGGENFKIGVGDGESETFLPITDYITITTEWQKVSIPLNDFAGVNLSSVKIPWDAYFSKDFTDNAEIYVDYIRWVGPRSK